MNVFNDYSKYYDLLYQSKPYIEEANHVAKLFKEHGIKPNAKLLELGVGTAKHALQLASLGYQIHGVDFSNTMLDMAKKQLDRANPEIAQKITLKQGDVRKYQCDEAFDAAYSLFHVMSYQTTNQDLHACFETVKKHVQPGGIFLFDCWYGPAVLALKPEVRYAQLQNQELNVERISCPTLNANDNTVDVHYHLFIQNKQGDFYQKLEESHKMRYWFLPEIKDLCRTMGLKMLYAKEWMTQGNLSTQTWGACFIIQL